MATLTNINTPVVNPAGAPTTNAISAATDQFAAQYGARYLLRFTNGSAVAANIVLVDATSVAPLGATVFTPNVTVAMPGVAGSVRSIVVDANRFRDGSGNIVWTYSASMVNAASLVEIYKI